MTATIEPSVTRAAAANLPTRHGPFTMIVYLDHQQKEQVALTCGDLSGDEPVLARLHSECMTGDVFASERCDCGPQLDAALNAIQAAGRGVLLYLRQEGRGIGLINKLRAYSLQQQGLDTVDANRALGLPDDQREYGVAAAMLRELGVSTVRLMSNNPLKITGLEGHGITVAGRVPLHVAMNEHNEPYIQAKRLRMGHLE